MNRKTPIYFGPPLDALVDGNSNTLERSATLNRTAERYLAMRQHHGVTLAEPERQCLREICQIGFMSPLEIAELPLDVRRGNFQIAGLNTDILAQKLDQASFADLVVMIDALGF